MQISPKHLLELSPKLRVAVGNVVCVAPMEDLRAIDIGRPRPGLIGLLRRGRHAPTSSRSRKERVYRRRRVPEGAHRSPLGASVHGLPRSTGEFVEIATISEPAIMQCGRPSAEADQAGLDEAPCGGGGVSGTNFERPSLAEHDRDRRPWRLRAATWMRLRRRMVRFPKERACVGWRHTVRCKGLREGQRRGERGTPPGNPGRRAASAPGCGSAASLRKT